MEDHTDYQKLMSAVLRQAIDDYIKLQHPHRRRKREERNAFWTACDLFWDETCVLAIQDEEGRLMTLLSLAQAASDRENVSLDKLRTYLIDESTRYWSQKDVNTLAIPDGIVIEGHAYEVRQASNYELDLDDKVIYLDKTGPTAEEELMLAAVDLACLHGDIKTSGKARKDLGKAIYKMLRINNCFTGDK